MIQTSNASVLLDWCHWDENLPPQHEDEMQPVSHRGCIQTLSKPPATPEHTSRKLLLLTAAPSFKCWSQHALLKNITKTWSFSRKQQYTNGTPESHIKNCALGFVQNTTGKQIFLWFFSVNPVNPVWNRYSSEASSWATLVELIYKSGHSKSLADFFFLHRPENNIIH